MAAFVRDIEATSRLRRQLPGRLVVAWAVLGAAASASLMYVPFVYQAQSTDLPLFTTRIPYEGRVRVCGITMYDDEAWQSGQVRRAIDGWRRGMTAGLASVGAVFGALIGRREQRRWSRSSDRVARGGSLGRLAGAVVFTLLFYFGTPGDVEWSLYQWLRWEVWWLDQLSITVWQRVVAFYAPDATLLIAVSGAIGWAVHVAAGARGWRLSPGRRPEQAADYGDDVGTPTIADGSQGGPATKRDAGGQAPRTRVAPDWV